MVAPIIRPAVDADLAAITAIYNDQGVATAASLDWQPATRQERAAWLAERRRHNHPVLVATGPDDRVCGFASYGSFRTKPGFHLTVEHSVYVAADQQGGGVGTALMTELIVLARRAGLHVMVGVVDAENLASRAFHARLGFVEHGLLPQVGDKFGAWHDMVLPVLILSEDAPRTAGDPR